MLSKPTVSLRCDQCGDSFFAWPVEVRKGRRFCSYACSVLGRTKAITERFWSKVEKSEGCWLWTGATVPPYGYGFLGRGKAGSGNIYAHRLAWELHFGSIPEGHFVCHHCDTPPCVRPDHLFVGLPSENSMDMAIKERQRHKLTAAQVAKIRASVDMTQAQLARIYGVSHQLISRILAGQIRIHVQDLTHCS